MTAPIAPTRFWGYRAVCYFLLLRNIEQPGSALAWGVSGRKFKSCYSDQSTAYILARSPGDGTGIRVGFKIPILRVRLPPGAPPKQSIMVKLVPMSRPCGPCIACCQGHLTGEAHGSKFYPGRPCAFISRQGCTIYPARPEDPCVSFECAYKYMHSIPEWLRPDRSNVIFVQRRYEDILYLHGSDTGKIPIPEVYEWAQTWAQEKNTYVVVPRDVWKKTQAPHKVSIYGPDNILKELWANRTIYTVVDL